MIAGDGRFLFGASLRDQIREMTKPDSPTINIVNMTYLLQWAGYCTYVIRKTDERWAQKVLEQRFRTGKCRAGRWQISNRLVPGGLMMFEKVAGKRWVQAQKCWRSLQEAFSQQWRVRRACTWNYSSQIRTKEICRKSNTLLSWRNILWCICLISRGEEILRRFKILQEAYPTPSAESWDEAGRSV